MLSWEMQMTGNVLYMANPSFGTGVPDSYMLKAGIANLLHNFHDFAGVIILLLGHAREGVRL